MQSQSLRARSSDRSHLLALAKVAKLEGPRHLSSEARAEHQHLFGVAKCPSSPSQGRMFPLAPSNQKQPFLPPLRSHQHVSSHQHVTWPRQKVPGLSSIH